MVTKPRNKEPSFLKNGLIIIIIIIITTTITITPTGATIHTITTIIIITDKDGMKKPLSLNSRKLKTLSLNRSWVKNQSQQKRILIPTSGGTIIIITITTTRTGAISHIITIIIITDKDGDGVKKPLSLNFWNLKTLSLNHSLVKKKEILTLTPRGGIIITIITIITTGATGATIHTIITTGATGATILTIITIITTTGEDGDRVGEDGDGVKEPLSQKTLSLNRSLVKEKEILTLTPGGIIIIIITTGATGATIHTITTTGATGAIIRTIITIITTTGEDGDPDGDRDGDRDGEDGDQDGVRKPLSLNPKKVALNHSLVIKISHSLISLLM